MARTRFPDCGTCPRKKECEGRCARPPRRDRWGKRVTAMRRLFEGRLLTQKILDIEASLRPPLSKMARLYYREGLTQSQIARRLGVTQCTASRILAKLHAEVHRRYHRQVRALHRHPKLKNEKT